MRRFLAIVPMLISACAGTNAAVTSGAHFVRTGIYSASSSRLIPDSSSPTGARRQPADVTWLADTTTIPAVLGAGFGVEFEVTVPSVHAVRTTVTWRFPAAGLTNPETGQTFYVYSREIECAPQRVCQTGWTFGESWELVPGVWEVEIAIGNRPAIKQSFNVVP
jgi:hypothetical protein